MTPYYCNLIDNNYKKYYETEYCEYILFETEWNDFSLIIIHVTDHLDAFYTNATILSCHQRNTSHFLDDSCASTLSPPPK